MLVGQPATLEHVGKVKLQDHGCKSLCIRTGIKSDTGGRSVASLCSRVIYDPWDHCV